MKSRDDEDQSNTSDGYDNPNDGYDVSDDEDEPDDDQKVESVYDILERHGFKVDRHLKSGVSGDVTLFEYTGDNPNIAKLLVNGIVLGKVQVNREESEDEDLTEKEKRDERNLKAHAVQSFLNEFNLITNKLANADPANETMLRPRTFAIEIEGIKLILNECVHCNPEKTRVKDLEQHIRELGRVHSFCDRLIDSERQETIANFTKIFISMVNSQRQCHRSGILHLDPLPRNFGMTADDAVKVFDFGASLQMNEKGLAVNQTFFKVNPITAYNGDAIRNRNDPAYCKSIHTDLFGIKIAMIETMAYYMGLTTKEISQQIHYAGLPSADRSGLLSLDDVSRLQNCLQNLSNVAQGLSNQKDVRGEVVQDLIKQFGRYLTSVPTGDNYQQISRMDYLTFQQRKPSGATANIYAKLHLDLGAVAQQKHEEVKVVVPDPVNSSSKTVTKAVEPEAAPDSSPKSRHKL